MELNIEINFQQIAVICIILFIEYVLVFFIVIVDLVSGLRKAKSILIATVWIFVAIGMIIDLFSDLYIKYSIIWKL